MSMVNSVIRPSSYLDKFGWHQRESNHFPLFQRNIFRIHRLFQCKLPVVPRIDNHVLLPLRLAPVRPAQDRLETIESRG